MLKRPVGSSFAIFPAPRTYATLWAIEGPFDFVRAHYVNSALCTVPIVASFAVSAQANDGYTPVGGVFSSFTFRSSATTCFDLPAATGPKSPSLAPSISSSDLMAAPSLEPTDGSLSWLMCRTYLSKPGYLGSMIPGGLDAYRQAAGARATRGFSMGVDGVTTPSAFSKGVETGFILPTCIEVFARAPGVSGLGIGDSISSGGGSRSGIDNWGSIACAMLSRPSLPLQWINGSWPGTPSKGYFALGNAQIEAFRPNLVTISPFSPNDGFPTQASIDTAWSGAMATARLAASRGAAPILSTPIPWNLPPTAEALRQQVCARVRTMGRAGMLVMDFDAAIRDPDNPSTALGSLIEGGANLHPNDAGNAAMATVALPVLERAIARA